MKTIAILAALCLGQTPADPPRSVLAAADGRPVFGWMDRGMIRYHPAEQTPENLRGEAGAGAIGLNLANGVDAVGLHQMQSGRFSTNDPRFDPARCTPDPAPAAPSIPYPTARLRARRGRDRPPRPPEPLAAERRDPQPRGRGAGRRGPLVPLRDPPRRRGAGPGRPALRPPVDLPGPRRPQARVADQVIGRKLGDHQAAQLSAAITGNPAPAPAPTPAPAATPAGAPG